MLDRTQKNFKLSGEAWQIGNYILPIAFLGIAGSAMIVWIGGLLWASWRLVTWIFS